MKKRVAIWLYGGIGTGNFSQGQPVLDKLVSELSVEFEIVVYTQAMVNKEYVPHGFVIRMAPRSVTNRNMRWMLLIKYFVVDHFRDRYAMVCAFWGFPGGFLATVVAKLFFLPTMINLQGGDATGIASLNYGVMHRPLFRRLALWTYRQATVLTVLTLFQEDLLRRYEVVRPIRVIPLGVDPDRFQPLTKARDPEAPCHFIHISNYNPIKDPETLLRAFGLICKKMKAQLRIVGGEYGQNEVSALCQRLGIGQCVEFCGPVLYSDIPAYFQWADILMHTSIYEGQGIVIAEAAMCGVLIAGTEVGLISDLGEAGAIIAPVQDYTTLAERILEAFHYPDACVEKKKVARAWASHHDFQWTVGQYRETFNELAKANLKPLDDTWMNQ